MKTKMVKNITPWRTTEDVEVNAETQRIIDFDNKNQVIKYTASIVEDGEDINFSAEYLEEGTVDDVLDRMSTPQNVARMAYAQLTDYSSSKVDPERKMWHQIADFVEANSEQFFDEYGNWRKDDNGKNVIAIVEKISGKKLTKEEKQTANFNGGIIRAMNLVEAKVRKEKE